MNGIGSMQFDVVSDDGSYVPALDAEVILTEDGTRIFGGTITGVAERGFSSSPGTAITSDIAALDFNALATRRYFGEPIGAITLKAALTQILPYLAGVTLHASQVDGPTLPAMQYSVWKISDLLDLFTTLTGYVWRVDYLKVLRMFVPGSQAAPFNLAAGDGLTVGDVRVERIRDKYANKAIVFGSQGIYEFSADVGEIATYGYWEIVVFSPDTTTSAQALALSAAVLAASLPVVKRLTYDTHNAGLVAGHTQTINLPTRHVNNTFLVTDIQTRMVGAGPALRTVTASEGVVYQTGWRETIKEWGVGGSLGGVVAPGVGSAGAMARFAYFLGGSGVDAIHSATPTWVPASPIEVQINTVPRGTLAALVVVRLRALSAGVSVKARLFDVTTATPCAGESALVTSTTFQTVTFTSTLTAGSHLYRLELLPGAANEPVSAVGYVE